MLPLPTQQARLDIVSLNSRGIRYLDMGMFCEALVAFRSALREMSDRMSRGDKPWLCDLSRTVFAPHAIANEHVGNNPSSHNVLHLHISPFQLSHAYLGHSRLPSSSIEEAASESRCSSINSIAAVLLYNVGLAHHFLALKMGVSDGHFRIALKMYEMATVAIYRDESTIEGMDESRLRVLLAIYNNQAHARFQFFELPTCAMKLNALRYILSLSNFSNEANYHKLLLNCLSAQVGLDTMAAPAA